MKKLLMGIFAGTMLCSLSLAQNPTPQTESAPSQAEQTPAQPAPAGQSTGVPRIAPGSVIPVQLTKTVDAKKVKTGEEVVATVTQDLKTQSGQVLMPKDTKVVGHVTEAQPRTKEEKESQLGITFDHAVLKDGGDMPLPTSIQAVIAPLNQNPDNSGGGSAAPSPSAGGGGATTGRPSGGMGGAQQQAPSSNPAGAETSPSTPSGNNSRPPITANTQGVVGLSNYKLSTSGDVTQGSVVSSEKSNVKLESGTLMLLRVNQ
jgi:hypothetical protein